MTAEARLRSAASTLADLAADPKLRKVAAAVVVLGLVAYAAAGWVGLVVLAVCLAFAAWFRPIRQRLVRWYLLG